MSMNEFQRYVVVRQCKVFFKIFDLFLLSFFLLKILRIFPLPTPLFFNMAPLPET